AFAAVDAAAGDRLADVVVVFPDRLDEVLARTDALRAEGVKALAQPPAVVAALDDDVDLLVEVLADVGRPELARLLVASHSPDVAEAVGPGLGAGARPIHERIVLGDGVVLARVLAIDVDAVDLAEQRLKVLGVVEGIAGGAAVAEGEVEVAVGAEADGAAVVVPERPLHAEQLLLEVRIGLVRVALADAETRQHVDQLGVLRGVEGEELAVLLVARMKRQAEEALLVLLDVEADAVLDVEEDLRLLGHRTVGEDV